MTYPAIGLIAVWIGGLLLLAGLYMNDIRLVLNNVTPGKRVIGESLRPRPAYMVAAFLLSPLDLVVATVWLLVGRSSRMNRFKKGPLGAIDPGSLSETGQTHLQRTIRHEWILLAWMVGGFIMLVWWQS